MTEIVFEASFGLKTRTVKLLQLANAGGGYQIYINNFYYGMLTTRSGTWLILANQPWFTADDVQSLAERVEGIKHPA